jgi:stromal membrane-associated protein
MQKWGNGRAKEYYEANVPRDYRIPNEHSSVREKEMWIREKYERKRFVAKDGERSRRNHDDDDNDSSNRSNSRTNSRTSSRDKPAPAPAPKPAPKAAPTTDFLGFDAFSAPPPAPAPTPAASAQAPKQDEWANFGGSSANSGFGAQSSAASNAFGVGKSIILFQLRILDEY